MGNRKLIVEIVGDATSLVKSFRDSSKESEKFGKKMEQSGSRIRSSLVGLAAGITGGIGLVEVLKTSSEAASNLAEQTSAAGVVFGEASKQVESFARNALLLSTDQALEAATALGSLLIPMGFAQRDAARLSVEFTKLGRDFSSFKNIPVDEALTAIRAGLVGEFEPLRRLGVVLSAAVVETEALRETGKKSAKQLTEQEKVQARMNLILKQSTLAQGDAARTLGGLANQQRELSSNIRDVEGMIGTALNPAITELVGNLNKWLTNSKNQKRLLDAIRAAVAVVTDVVHGLTGAFNILNGVTGGTKNTLKIILAAFVAMKVLRVLFYIRLAQALLGVATSIKLIGKQAQFASRQVRLLGIGLTTLGTIAIAEVIREMTKPLLDKANLGFLDRSLKDLVTDAFTADPIVIPTLKIKVAKFSLSLPPINTANAGFIVDFFKRQAAKRFGTGTPFLDLGRAQAESTKQLFDDLANSLRRIVVLRERLAKARGLKEQTDLQNAINAERARAEGIRSEIRGIRQAAAERRRDAKARRDEEFREDARRRARARTAARLRLETSQFATLGLGPGGAELVPNAASLKKTFNRLRKAVRGTTSDTPENRKAFAGIAELFLKGLKNIQPAVRAWLDDFFDQLDDKLGERGPKVAAKWKKISVDAFINSLGLDLTSAQRARLKAGLLRSGGTSRSVPPGKQPAYAAAGGGGGMSINTVNVYGVQDVRQLEGELAKRARSRPQVRRGAR